MKRIFAFFFAAVIATAAVGCTRFVSSYTFNSPPSGESRWKQVYPKDGDTAAVKCMYTDAWTGAVIRVIEDPCDKPDVVRSAQAMARLYRESGYDVGTVMLCERPGGKYASFAYARDGERGMVVAVRRPNVPKTFMLVGVWPAADDFRASAGIAQLAEQFEVEAERMPVE